MNLEADPELQVRTQAKNVIPPFDAPIKDSMQSLPKTKLTCCTDWPFSSCIRVFLVFVDHLNAQLESHPSP